ncbi:hypothetical protein SDC9_168241 [bioreactor metagenome]|uniref:Uncharacterized protein n=1 Tax=bioreactor metagenome TaxID=1076179 RepID=A0A645G4I0_9ZZZZ
MGAQRRQQVYLGATRGVIRVANLREKPRLAVVARIVRWKQKHLLGRVPLQQRDQSRAQLIVR